MSAGGRTEAGSKGGAKAKPSPRADRDVAQPPAPEKTEEIGGPKGPEPTRYGDWEKGGRCSDF